LALLFALQLPVHLLDRLLHSLDAVVVLALLLGLLPRQQLLGLLDAPLPPNLLARVLLGAPVLLRHLVQVDPLGLLLQPPRQRRQRFRDKCAARLVTAQRSA